MTGTKRPVTEISLRKPEEKKRKEMSHFFVMKEKKKYFRIAERIAAYITGSATDEDQRELKEWERESSRNTGLLKDLANEARYVENREMLTRFSADTGWKKIQGRLSRQSYFRINMLWKYAAVIFLLIGGGAIYFRVNQEEKIKKTVIVQSIPSGKQGARLTLGDGRVVEVTPDKKFTIAEIDGTLIKKDLAGIDYIQAEVAEEQMVYNQMETLTGMEYALTLSDGSRVYMNAESSLRFPVAFRGEQRVVELKGEAYFKVAKDAAHPFIVKMDGVELKVLGTSFNARYYANEPRIVTTLVEGQVEINGKKIIPGEQASCNREDGKIYIAGVDTRQYTAWQGGRFVFRNERLEDVMKSLTRWYGVEYHFLDEKVKDIRIGASFGRYEDMSPIIKMLRQTELVDVLQTNHSLYLSEKKQ